MDASDQAFLDYHGRDQGHVVVIRDDGRPYCETCMRGCKPGWVRPVGSRPSPYEDSRPAVPDGR